MLKLLNVATVLALYAATAVVGNPRGYKYERPSVPLTLVPDLSDGGHKFEPLSTVEPLPPVPALPPLPTPRSKGRKQITHTVYQTHPIASSRPVQSTYVSHSGSGIGKIAQQYESPAHPISAPSAFAFSSSDSRDVFVPSLPDPNPELATAQPLRIPYGKQAIISYPTPAGGEGTYEVNGRQLKQYAVIEIIDNDIEQDTQPYMSTPFFDSYRAHVGASGTGALDGDVVQITSKASDSLLQQQRASARSSASDAVALGSGGLGFIRLANGKVYLGSGSLGYVSSQQHIQSVNEARTRTGAPRPDALHFGHGPLGGSNNYNRFLYRLK